MSLIQSFNGKTPHVADGAFVAPTATIIGDVTIEEGASIWYGAVLRGDRAAITIGANTSVQDNCTIHCDADHPCHIGANVTVGHNAVVHGCTVEDGCLIGIHATVLDGAIIKTGSVVAAGSVVLERQQVGPRQLVAGVPADFKKAFSAGFEDEMARHAGIYVQLGAEHAGLND